MNMPLQNRVTPFGDIIATASRGALTGNRGIIHDPDTRQLLGNRRWSTKAWIYCLCDFNKRKRDVFGRNGRNGGAGWTNLFFLDEATALSAGHRPCFYCQRQRANAFRDAWVSVHGGWDGVQSVDAILHHERLNQREKRLHDLGEVSLELLPLGAMVAAGHNAFALTCDGLRQWSPDGYGHGPNSGALEPSDSWRLLTPPSIVSVLQAGFEPAMASSA